MRVRSLGWKDPLEKGMVTHSSILACRISWTEDPDRLTLHNVAQNQTQLKQLSMLSLLMSPLKALSISSSVFYL